MFLRFCCASVLFVFSSLGIAVEAAPMPKNSISVEKPWIRPAKATQNTALYMTLQNGADESDCLIKADCEAAEYIELHNHIHENGIMKMRPVNKIDLQKNPVDMKPGGLHVMLFKLKKDLSDGDKIPVTLIFEKAGKIEVLVTVGKPA